MSLNWGQSVSLKPASDSQVSVQGWTPLHLASRNGHAGCVKSLLENKADVTLVDEWKVRAVDQNRRGLYRDRAGLVPEKAKFLVNCGTWKTRG